MTTQNLIIRDFHGATIRQRSSDGYFDSTAMCKATGKKIKNYRCNNATQEFLIALSKKLETPIESQRQNSALDGNKGLMEITRGGNNAGTWIHSRVAIHLAIWCNPEFAVLVTDWVYELLTKGTVSLNPNKSHQEITIFAEVQAKKLDNLGIVGNAKQISINNSIKEKFDLDTLKILNIKSQPAEIQQALLNPTKIAERTGLQSAKKINLKLIEMGLQIKHYDQKKQIYYELTKEGLKYAQYQDVGIGKTTRRTIKWYESVLKLFQPALTSKPTHNSTLQTFLDRKKPLL